MPRAVLREGMIYPLDPLPPDWVDGLELQVEVAEELQDSPEEIDRRFEKLEELVAQIDPEDHRRLEAALAEADAQAKEYVRREMGLP